MIPFSIAAREALEWTGLQNTPNSSVCWLFGYVLDYHDFTKTLSESVEKLPASWKASIVLKFIDEKKVIKFVRNWKLLRQTIDKYSTGKNCKQENV